MKGTPGYVEALKASEMKNTHWHATVVSGPASEIHLELAQLMESPRLKLELLEQS